MRDHRILTQVGGPDVNIIKLLPPLIIGDEEVDAVLAAFAVMEEAAPPGTCLGPERATCQTRAIPMNQMLDVWALADDIGRAAPAPRERSHGRVRCRRLSVLGLQVERESFQAVASQNAFPLAIDLVALIAVAAYSFGGTVGRWLGAGSP